MQQQGTNGRPLVPYIRQSRAKERTISLTDQREAIEKWAEVNKVELVEPIEEPGVSGSKHWRERGLGEAIAACERGEAAGIIVAFQDRLSRENGIATAEVWQTLEQLKAQGSGRLVCAAEGLDTATGDQELLFSIKAAIAREQWKRHKFNWESGRRNAIERGVHTSMAPAGYTPSVVLDEDGNPKRDKDDKIEHGPLVPNEHAPAVLAAFAARAKGASWTQVAALLTSLGVPTGKDRRRNDGTRTPWSIKSAQTTLSNPTYLGQVRSGEFVREDAHDEIVDAALWRRVRARDQQKGSWSTEKRERAMLADALKCANCGRAMTRDSGTRQDGSRYWVYRCRNFGFCSDRPTIALEMIERYVSDWIIDQVKIRILHPPKYGTKGTGRGDLEKALRAAEAELEAFVTATSASEIGADLFAKGLAQRKRVVDETQQALLEIEDDAEAFKGLPPEILKGARREGFSRRLWEEGMTDTERNRWVRRYFPTGILVKRGRGLEERIGDLDAFALQEVADAA